MVQQIFEATANALGENTNDLTAAIESVYGKEGADAFNKMWSDSYWILR
jgi:hypothetical protein